VILVSCNETKKQSKEEKYLKESYKEQKSKGLVSEHSENLDTLTNIYSNYKYLISFDAPDNWKIDYGTAKHSIFRGNDPELALTFSIIVAEPKYDEEFKLDAWELHQKSKLLQEKETIEMIKTQYNTNIQNYKAEKSYIKNFVSSKKSFDFIIRSSNLEYVNHTIVHQVNRNNFIYTFTEHVPKVVYDKNPDYFENIFNNITFSANPELIKDSE
jgi:hypothetical protein